MDAEAPNEIKNKRFFKSGIMPKKNTKPPLLYHGFISWIKSNKLLVAVLFLALFFRFWMIFDLPAGLFPDEAANGLDINMILSGEVQPFYERGNGREALFFYLLTLSVLLFGRGHWQHHIVSAGLGFFAVVATYYLARRIFDKNTALIAAFLMSVSSYAVTLSRTAFRANTVPLFTTLTLLFLIRLYQEKDDKKKLYSAIFAGVSFGLGFYTYISYRMMIPLMFVFGAVLLLGFRHRLKNIWLDWKRYAIAFKLAFLASFSWLLYYFIRHPESIVGRAGQVSIFSEDLNQGDIIGTFLEVFKLTIVGFFTNGDLNWRHNVSGFPFLSPFISIFFALALVVFTYSSLTLLYQAWRKRIEEKTFLTALVAGWFWVMLVPEITTAEGIPHGLRLIGVIPPIFILAAWGINWFWQKLKNIVQDQDQRLAIASVFFLAIFFYNFILYFHIAATSPGYYYAFRSDLTEVSQYINNRNNQSNTFLSLDTFSVQTVEYLTTKTQHPYTLVDPAQSYLVEMRPGDQIIFTMSTLFDRIRFLDHHLDAELVYSGRNKFGEITMLVYEKL